MRCVVRRLDRAVNNAYPRLTNMEVIIVVKSDMGKFEILIARSTFRFNE